MRSAPDTPPSPTITTPAARLLLSCLGACQVVLDGKPVTTFRSQKTLALLMYLAVEAERPHHRSRLAGLLWPDYSEQAARHSLRQVLAILRLALRWAVEPLTATLAASLTSLPILLYHFGRLSLIAPLANVLMLPAVPYAMLFGSLAAVGGMLWLPLGQLLALLAWPFLEWLLLVARVLAHVPGGYTTVPPFSVGWVWLVSAGDGVVPVVGSCNTTSASSGAG